MKKLFIFCLSFFYILLLYSCSNNNELRLRILASSNSKEDQYIKNQVKEYTKDYLSNIDNVYNINIKELEEYLNQKFTNHLITVKKTKVNYEAKHYKNKIIQAGRYETILITIDEGKGKNFWTLLYPEFFNISFEEDNEIEYRSYLYDLFTK